MKKLFKLLLHIFWLCPIRKKKIILTNFNGSSIGGNAKAILDYALQNKLDYKFYWIVNKKFDKKANKIAKNVKYIKKYSLPLLYHIATAKTVISDINPISFIPYRKKQTLINTWHGYGFKGNSHDENTLSIFELNNAFLACNQNFVNYLIKGVLNFKGDVLNIGFPKNDIFFDKDKCDKIIKKVNDFYSIGEKKTILYAPTFRSNFLQEPNELDFALLKKNLEAKFGGEWVVLYRCHPMIADKIDFSEFKGVINASFYPDMQELLVACDILITDYSSSVWDFSFTNRPVFLFTPDFDSYVKDDKGFCYPPEKWPYSIARNNKELEINIKKFDDKQYKEGMDRFYKDIDNYETGTACKQLFEYIKSH